MQKLWYLAVFAWMILGFVVWHKKGVMDAIQPFGVALTLFAITTTMDS